MAASPSESRRHHWRDVGWNAFDIVLSSRVANIGIEALCAPCCCGNGLVHSDEHRHERLLSINLVITSNPEERDTGISIISTNL